MDRSPALEAARRVCARVNGRGPGHADDDAAAAVDGVISDLRGGLSPWIGADAYSALLRRSIQGASGRHPVLEELDWETHPPAGTVAAVARHGVEAVTDACVAVVGGMIDHLARVVGPHMAIQLVEQSIPRRHRAAAGPEEERHA